jgi:hypothetical protein
LAVRDEKEQGMRRLVVLLAVTGLIAAGCGGDNGGGEAQPEGDAAQAVAVTAANYTFAGVPASIDAGTTTITLKNAGPEPHQAQLLKLNDGVTDKQLIASGKKDANALDLLKLASYAGGPNGIDTGETQVTSLDVQPGTYAFVCLIPDAKGNLHLGLGMAKTFEVTETQTEGEKPEAEYTSISKDFSFELPEAWDGPISFENRGEQPHEFQVIGIAEGKTAADVEKSFSAEGGGGSGPPPWTADGGAAAIAPDGGTQVFEVDLEPGTYFAMCFVVDPEKKAPHFALGMMQKFEVKET